jgi:hypothetical protein
MTSLAHGGANAICGHQTHTMEDMNMMRNWNEYRGQLEAGKHIGV